MAEFYSAAAGQSPPLPWTNLSPPHTHEMIGDPTYADAILDRLVHNAHRIEMSGESMRKKNGRKPETMPVDSK